MTESESKFNAEITFEKFEFEKKINQEKSLNTGNYVHVGVLWVAGRSARKF